MKNYVKVLAVALVIMLLLCGCSSADTTTTEPTETSDNARTDLVIGLVGEPTTLEPATSATDARTNGRLVNNIYEGLLSVDDAANISPNIAESWDISDDGLTYTFHLLSDVKFHNGDTVTAQDVKYSFDNCINVGYSPEVTGNFAETSAPDDNTFVLKLGTPCVTTLSAIANCKSLYIANKKIAESMGEDFSINPVGAGSGPYKFESWEKGANITLVANEEYRNGAPAIKKVVFKFIPEQSSGAIALETGDIDLYTDLNLVDVPNLQTNPDLKVEVIQSRYVWYLCPNMLKEPFDDLRVRQAIAYAINLDELCATVTNNLTDYKTGSLTTPECFGYLKLDPIGQDIEKSKALLAEAGYPDGLDVDIACESGSLKCVETLQGMLAKAGINVTVNQMELSAMLEYVEKNEHEIAPMIEMGFMPDADAELGDKVVSDAWGNWSRFNIPRFDELMVQARQETDSEKRIAMYAEIQQTVYDQMLFIPLYYDTNATAAKAGLKGFHANKDMYLYLPDFSW